MVLGALFLGVGGARAGTLPIDWRNLIAADAPIIFSVTGDIPYTSDEISVFQVQIDEHDLYSPSEFLVHVGDIKSGGGTCSESYYSTAENILKSSVVPCFIVPGDNETTDCSNTSQAWSYWTKHLLGIEKNWPCTPPVERQSSRPENFAFVSKGMLFIGINLVGGSNATSLQNDDATWVSQQLSGKKSLVRGAVIFAQAGPGSDRSTFNNQFVPAATSFGKPILYIHGDGHSWILDHPYSASNVTRVQVDNGGAALPVQVTATLSTSSMFQFDRTPWDSSSDPITRPPCGTSTNHAPVAANDAYNVRVNTALTVPAPGVLGNDTDSDGNALTAILVATTTHGSLSLAANGSFTYTPSSGFLGADSFTYRASDGSLQSGTATVALTVANTLTLGPVADAQVNDGSPTSNYGTSSELRAKTDTGIYRSYLKFTVSGAGTIQAATLRLFVTDPSPVGGSIHPVSNTYAGSTTAWTETGLNYTNAPLISAPALATAGNAATGTWVEWDVTAGVPGDGTYSFGLQSNSDDSVRYSSKEGANPPQLVLAMGTGGTTNRPPVAGNDSYTVAEDAVLSVAAPGVLGNDTDPDGDALTAAIVSGPTRGTLALNGNGSFTYTPQANFNGSDSFTYRASDGKGGSATATAAITVTPVSDAPVAAANTYTVQLNTTLAVAAPGVLGNDTDADGNTLTAVLVATTSQGTLSLAANGSFTYTPSTDFTGTDTFTYRASDGTLQSGVTTVTLNVSGPTFMPVADAYVSSSSPTKNYGTASDLRAQQNDFWSYFRFVVSGMGGVQSAKLRLFVTDASSSGGSVYVVSDTYAGTTTPWTETGINASNAPAILDPALATRGTVAVGTWVEFDVSGAVFGNGTYDFGLQNFANDRVAYSSKEGTNPPQLVLTAGSGGSTNSPPVAVNDTYTVGEDAGLSVAAPGVLGNDSDPDGDALTASILTQPAHGSLTLNANGSFTYTPAANFNGADGFNYRASDGKGGTASASVSITVTPVNDAPVAAADAYSVQQGGVLSVGAPGVLGNDSDPEGSALSAALETTTTQGTLSLAANGSFTYTPNSGFTGTDGFTYRASDGALQSAVTQVTVSVGGTVSGTVAFQEVQTGGSAAVTTVATTAPLAAAAGDLYLAAIASKGYAPVTGVTGLGLTWTRVRAQCAGRNQTGVEVWMARGTPSSSIVTATLSAAPNSAVIAVSRWSGVSAASPIATIVPGNTLGVDGLCSGGVDTATFAFDLAVPAEGGTVFGAVAMRNRTLTPGAGYTKRAEVHQGLSGSEATVAVVDQSAPAGTTRLDGSFESAVDWAVIGLVLRPASSAAKVQASAAEVAERPLYRIFPNPARGMTSILYELTAVTAVHASIYDVAGRRVRVLLDGSQSPGRRVLQWNARDDAGNLVPSGVYFVHMQIGARQLHRKFILQK
jgi:VCBS repeat-containing protein